jgi:hypothetical protein
MRSVAASALPSGSSSEAGAVDTESPSAALLALSAQQRGVTGAVLRWSDAVGLETLPASEYISDLEGEVRRLRDTLASLQRAGEGRNPLLEELKAMEPSNLAELTTRAVRASITPCPARWGRLVMTCLRASASPGGRRAGSHEHVHQAAHGAAWLACAAACCSKARDGMLTVRGRVRVMFYAQGGLEGDGLALARGSMNAPELARLLYWLLVVGYSLRTIEVRFDLDAQLGLPPSALDASDC